ncbi:hypothetical protein KCP69_08710 [Salmonella enterica subsp. enterica]|nr:hypothetical protein KCP69_08710 [Salmonella enterica subsp. enterica]
MQVGDVGFQRRALAANYDYFARGESSLAGSSPSVRVEARRSRQRRKLTRRRGKTSSDKAKCCASSITSSHGRN